MWLKIDDLSFTLFLITLNALRSHSLLLSGALPKLSIKKVIEMPKIMLEKIRTYLILIIKTIHSIVALQKSKSYLQHTLRSFCLVMLLGVPLQVLRTQKVYFQQHFNTSVL